MAYRISPIPKNVAKVLLVWVVRHVFSIESAQFEIHSLADDALYESESYCKTATMSFRTRPPQLDPACAESGGWSFKLGREVAERYGSDRIYFDNRFDVFTPLSSAENSDKQTIE